MATKQDSRQIVLRELNPFIGNAANEQLNVVFPRIDAEMAKLYEDRNIFLTDGGIITFTGTQIQFTENLNIVLNQKISGAAPQVISLGSANVTLNNGDMWYAVINRTAGTATTAIASTLPAVVAANQEVFLIVKRVDAGDGTQRIYWRSGMAQNAGQSNRLGASGSGTGGSGVGDDLDALLYRASFRDGFDEGPTDTKSAVDVTTGKTDATAYNAAKAMYTLNYDASKTIAAATTTTNINISAVAAFTVKVGDVVIANNQARRITAVATQASFTTEAFSVAPTLAAQVTVSQAIYSKDIYNFAVDGNALSAAFSGATFSDVMVDYEDTTTAGDNIFDVNVAPVVALSASPDGTTFTDVKSRPTLETDTVQSITLPSAGTGLFLRFFALKTSGSGIVNVLGYRAFMQKSVIATAGGVTNSAYGFTNGVGTPVNCSFSVVGGKTVVTLTWQYAVGVYSGTSASSIEVWLNGAKLPRFINSTLTPDASFLESSSSSFTLDRDYSFLNLSVEVFQRTQIVDNSTVNTTQISNHNEILQNGFQSFVSQNQLMNATAVAGTPVAGTFYSTITNRAPMADMTQDLKVRFGVDRIMNNQIMQLQNEFGPNGESVYAVPNDIFGQIRYVGQWGVDNSGLGVSIRSFAINDYVELTWYGTGLNLIALSFTGYDMRASVDGAAEIAVNVFTTTAPSLLLNNRNYAPNNLFTVVSGLPLGVHTVKLRVQGSTPFTNGFEFVGGTSALSINPGVSYVNGQKLSLASQFQTSSTSAFESGTLGTRGGHAVVYQKSDSTIAKAVNPAGTQLNLTAADHTNEEVVRTLFPREFGAARSDDFSLSPIASSAAFTLDDSVTTLIGSGCSLVGFNGGPDGVVASNTGSSFYTLTFVGTGLDIVRGDQTTAPDALTVFVDGTSIGNTTALGTTSISRQTKIVSGLPYGTHTVKFLRSGTNSGQGTSVSRFIVYQPKKPSIPAGAIELADYNVMATFSPNSTAGLETMSIGVYRKHVTREFIYVDGTGGTTSWSLNITSPTASIGAYTAFSDRLNANYAVTFFGTGFDLRYQAASNRSTNVAVTVNGLTLNTTNFPSLAATVYGGGSFNTGTGVFAQSTATQNGCGLIITGLPLTQNIVKFNNGTASSFLAVDSIDVIVSVHSHKLNVYSDIMNTLASGSQSLNDNRKLTPVKEALPAQKEWAQALGVTSGPTNTSTSLVPVPEMSVTVKTSGGVLQIAYSLEAQNNTNTANTFAQVIVDGLPVGTPKFVSAPGANNSFIISDVFDIPASPGVHTVQLYWAVTSGTALAAGARRSMNVREM